MDRRRSRSDCKRAPIMTGGGPPTVRVFRQGAHLGATNRSGRLFATAIAHRHWRPRHQRGRLVGKGGGGCDSHQNRDTNCLVEFWASRCHDSLWNRSLLKPIARWIEVHGIEVIEVPGLTLGRIQKAWRVSQPYWPVRRAAGSLHRDLPAPAWTLVCFGACCEIPLETRERARNCSEGCLYGPIRCFRNGQDGGK